MLVLIPEPAKNSKTLLFTTSKILLLKCCFSRGKIQIFQISSNKSFKTSTTRRYVDRIQTQFKKLYNFQLQVNLYFLPNQVRFLMILFYISTRLTKWPLVNPQFSFGQHAIWSIGIQPFLYSQFQLKHCASSFFEILIYTSVK